MDKQPLYYAWKLGSTAAMLGASIWLLVIANALWVHLLNAVFLGFVFAQFGFLGHDAGHRQMFRSGRNNEIVLFFVNLVILLDRSWWIDKHNRHHAHPNDLDRDRDVDLPFLAFTEDVALSKRGIYRLVVRYQAFCMYPLMMAEALSLRMDGFQYLLRGKNVKYMFAETSCIVLHLANLPWRPVLPAGAVARRLVHLGTPSGHRVLFGQRVCPEPQGHAVVIQGHKAGLPAPASAHRPQHQLQSNHRLYVRRIE